MLPDLAAAGRHGGNSPSPDRVAAYHRAPRSRLVRGAGRRDWMGQRMASQDEIVDALAGMALFADLTTPQLKGVAHIFDEGWFPAGERILRQGLSGSAFYVILEGEAAIVIDAQQRATVGKGEFFGDISILLGEPPVADVVATTPLRVLTLAGPAVEGFLKNHPTVMYRMLQAIARRLRNANRWRN
jgi:CRP-like cAMP-binding protein